eukprot:1490791-Amphidinium_carterae.1
MLPTVAMRDCADQKHLVLQIVHYTSPVEAKLRQDLSEQDVPRSSAPQTKEVEVRTWQTLTSGVVRAQCSKPIRLH